VSDTIRHFQSNNAHGPVIMYIDDHGRVALVCEEDGTSWDLGVIAKATKEPAKTATKRLARRTPAIRDSETIGSDLESDKSKKSRKHTGPKPTTDEIARNLWRS
jgi:hypothetical protein